MMLTFTKNQLVMRSLSLILFFFIAFNSSAQDFLNKALKNAKVPGTSKSISGLLVDKLLESHQEYDQEAFHYAISFSDNAGQFEAQERYDKHKLLLNKVRSSRMEDDDIEPEERADDLNKSGEMFYAGNKFFAAEVCFKQAMKLYADEEMKVSEKYAGALGNLALLYHTTGRYQEAATQLDKLEELRDELGVNLGYGVMLNNKAVLLKDKGEYREAQQLLEQSQKIVLEHKGEESLDYAILLNNHAMLHQTLGRYDEALRLMKESLEVAAISVGEKSAKYIKLQTNLALLYRDKGNLEKAEEVYLTAMKNKRRRLGKKHPDYAQLATGLAALYMEMGKQDEVEELLEEALSIYRKKFGNDHPVYAGTESDLGNFYRVTGEHKKAVKYLSHAKSIRSRKLGKKHPDYIQSIEDMALMRWAEGKIPAAMTYYEEVIEGSLQYVDDFFGAMSEHEKTRFWDTFQPRMHRYFAFVAAHHQEHPELVEQFFNVRLKTKALILTSYNQVRNAILTSNDTTLVRQYKEWVTAKEHLANVYTYTSDELKEQEIDVEELERQANKLESELSERSNAFAEGFLSNKQYRTADFKNQLKGDEALVEVVEYRQFDQLFTGDVAYLYLLVLPEKNEPILLQKTNGNEMTGKFLKYYNNAIRMKFEDQYSYTQYWKVVDEHISKKKKLYVTLDGVYSQLNINTLYHDNQYMVERQEIIFLNHSKDLQNVKNNTTSTFKNALLAGNPDFGGPSVTPLPGTAKEINAIYNIIKKQNITTRKFEGAEATEAAITANSGELMHIATHGFFLENVDASAQERVFGVRTAKAMENPLHRSGLLLAGAAKHKETAEEEAFQGVDPLMESESNAADNGILTAFEIKNLDLSGVKMVLLSACETAKGDVKVGEGVYGMQRSFQEAGVNQLVMSLWKVDDEATAELMVSFYNNLFSGKRTVSQAFRKAVMDIQKQYEAPYYWGAFMLING